MKKSLLSLALISLCASPLAYADPTCPSIEQLQAGGLEQAISYQGKYFAYQESDYGTPYNWGFIIGMIPADSEDDALEMASQNLSHLSGQPKAQYYSEKETWVCAYKMPSPYRALAVTPIPGGIRLNMAEMYSISAQAQ